MLFSAAVAVLFIRGYPVVTGCQYTSIDEFTMQFSDTYIDLNCEMKVLGPNCDEAERDSLYNYASLVKIAYCASLPQQIRRKLETHVPDRHRERSSPEVEVKRRLDQASKSDFRTACESTLHSALEEKEQQRGR
jgi:hypothetical protein